jgi:AcrR family transcriptional regulator
MKDTPAGHRAELMDRALELFAAYGYDGVGVQNVCEAAAVTKPTLYHYFHSKRGLLEALMQDRIGGLLSPLAELKAAGDTPETLRFAASLTMAFARNNPTFYRLYLALWFAPLRSEGHEVASKFHARHFEAMEAVCGAATRGKPGLRNRNRALTASFLGMLNNAIGLALNNYSALNDRAASDLVDQFLYGILRPAAARRRESDNDGDIPSGT